MSPCIRIGASKCGKSCIIPIVFLHGKIKIKIFPSVMRLPVQCNTCYTIISFNSHRFLFFSALQIIFVVEFMVISLNLDHKHGPNRKYCFFKNVLLTSS